MVWKLRYAAIASYAMLYYDGYDATRDMTKNTLKSYRIAFTVCSRDEQSFSMLFTASR
jgi:hypothetical protein